MEVDAVENGSVSRTSRFNFRATIGHHKKLLKILLPLAVVQIIVSLSFLVIKVSDVKCYFFT